MRVSSVEISLTKVEIVVKQPQTILRPCKVAQDNGEMDSILDSIIRRAADKIEPPTFAANVPHGNRSRVGEFNRRARKYRIKAPGGDKIKAIVVDEGV